MQAHPGLTEEEKSDICRAMEYEKLSQEARNHALRNDRLPLNTTIRFILLEQVSIIRSVTAAGSNYQRTKSQTIMRAQKSLGSQWINCQKEIKMMKQDVETMKAQLCQLQTCRMMLQRVAKRCTKV